MASVEKAVDLAKGERPEGEPFTAESQEAVEAAFDAAAEQIVGDDEEGEEEAPTRTGLLDDPTQPLPVPEAVRSKKEEKQQALEAEAAGEPTVPQDPVVSDTDVSSAYQAYMRDGFTKAQTDQLQKSLGDADFVDRGLHRLKVQTDTDRLYTSRSRDKVSPEEEAERSTQGEPAEPALPPSNLRDLATPFLEAVETGDQTKASDALGVLLQKAQEPVMAELRKAQELAVYAGESLASEWKDGALRELLGDDPGQLMGASRDNVEARFQELANSPVHKDLGGRARIAALTKMALQAAAPEALAQAAIRQNEGSASPKRKPTPTRPTTTSKKPTSKLTPDQKFERAAWGVVGGDKPLAEIAAEFRAED